MIKNSYKHLVIALSFITLSLFLLFNLNTNDIDVGKQGAQVGGSLNDGLVAYYSFDDVSGNILKDISQNGNDGVLVNNPTLVSGVKGNALQFDGIDDYVTLYNSDLSKKDIFGGDYGSVSLSFWVKSTKVDGITYDTIIKNIVGFDLIKIDQNGGLSSIFYNNELSKNEWQSFNFKLIPNTWTHIVMIFDGGKGFRTYINGNLDREFLSDKYLLIGRGDKTALAERYVSSTNYFQGLIDEMVVFKRALNINEIISLNNT